MSKSLTDRLDDLVGIPPLKARKPKKVKKVKNAVHIDPTRLDECSESELVSIALSLGIPQVSRAMDKEDLIEVIISGEPPEEGIDLVFDIRSKIEDYVTGNLSRISAADMRCDLNCPNCPSRMVVGCWATNKDLIE